MIGTTGPAKKLEVNGFVKATGFKTSISTNGAQLVYASGTGLQIGGTTVYNGASRGLTLAIVNKLNNYLIITTTYDTHASTASSDNLATALNHLTRDRIGILVSYDAIELSITNNLRTAAFRLSLTKLVAVSTGPARSPYAAICRGAGTGTGNTQASNQAIGIGETFRHGSHGAAHSRYAFTENAASKATFSEL